MGTNGKTSHAAYSIEPSSSSDSVDASAGPGSPQPDEAGPVLEESVPADLAQALEDLETIASGGEGALGGYPEVPEDPLEQFEAFAAQIAAAREAIEKMAADGAPPEVVQAHLDQLRATSLAYLSTLTPDQLREIAAARGFEHPALVGLSGTGQHPLVHWLDPYYDAGITSKNKIQAAALTRYDQLVAGQTVAGMTLADLHTLEGTTPPVGTPEGTWTASVAQVDQALKAHEAAQQAVVAASEATTPEQLKALLDADATLASAHCPGLLELESLQAGKKMVTHHALAAGATPASVKPLADAALEAGEISEAELNTLTPYQLTALMSGTGKEAEAYAEIAAQRQQDLDKLAAATAAVQAGKEDGSAPLALPDLASGPEATATVAGWLEAASTVGPLQQHVLPWASKSLGSAGGLAPLEALGDPAALTVEFKAWGKAQKLSDLRALAAEMGMPDTQHASRAHVQNYLASHFNPHIDPAAAIAGAQASAAAKKNAAKMLGKTSAAAPSQPPAATGAAAPVSSPASVPAAKPALKAPVKPAPPGSFQARVQAMVASLGHAKAAAKEVPARIDTAAVEAMPLDAGTAAHLGGTYGKSLHTAPDGSKWLFKSDHHGGVTARAEAAASHLLSLGGTPVVPVYAKEVGGQSGTVQPLLIGATPFPSKPGSWSQAQVDAIVRDHVASHLVGDHDGHAANMLLTPGGAIVRVDRGQAFKHAGSDKLALGYAPSGGGSLDPLHHKLYYASLNGQLAPGVKVNPAVAHPVIKSFEEIPDAQVRAVLHTAAHEGAKPGSNAAWVPAMRARAAKQHKIAQSTVTSKQIAEAFLDCAVERKNSLRQEFAAFYVDELQMPHAASLKYGG
ncbi:hypothetical protein BIV57_13490 [Mangrovactinospora gilvigrisea]|uniref:Uncharacterized protein n=1 Tax=Mangrovactinospora gilvigrisea TaxID=1428644 RepID=A0A1J7C636_9ACTN|nr:hypothetical protein [Mangrovactinospora gilvigrisea]OIV36996.1 hypothetical protein BIV57_13490 [Mangrovactinospora gilvigrisea]